MLTDTATPQIYTLSLHDALPILKDRAFLGLRHACRRVQKAHRLVGLIHDLLESEDRKSTRLNSSHPSISYAVFCLKKKKFFRFVGRRPLCGLDQRKRSVWNLLRH